MADIIPMKAPDVSAEGDPWAKFAEQAGNIVNDSLQTYKKSKESKDHVDNIYAGVLALQGNSTIDHDITAGMVKKYKPTAYDYSHVDEYEKTVGQGVQNAVVLTISQQHKADFLKQRSGILDNSQSGVNTPQSAPGAGAPPAAQPPAAIPAAPPAGPGSQQMGPPISAASPAVQAAQRLSQPSQGLFASVAQGGGAPPPANMTPDQIRKARSGEQTADTAMNQKVSQIFGTPMNPPGPTVPNVAQPAMAGLSGPSNVGSPAGATGSTPGASPDSGASSGPSGTMPKFSSKVEADIAKFPEKYRDDARTELAAWATASDTGDKSAAMSYHEKMAEITSTIRKREDEDHKLDKTLQNAKDINANTQTNENDRMKYIQDQENKRKSAELSLSREKQGANMGTLTDSQKGIVTRQAKMISEGHADPTMADLTGRGGMAVLKPYIEQELSDKYPEFNVNQAQGDRKYWNSNPTRKQLQVMNVVTEQLPKLKDASAQMKRLGIPALDATGIKALAAKGDVNAAEYIAASTASVEDVAKAISGGNALTDDQLKLAGRLIPPGATPEQLDKVISQIEKAVDSRKATVYQQGGIYGKIAAKNDPWLSEDIRQRILSGNLSGGGAGGSAKPASITSASGNTYTF